jgi:hypothetical protein
MIMVKTCGFCEKTDGMCYTSNPPKRKCTITGKFHEYDHICDVPQTNADRIRAMSDEELTQFLNTRGCPSENHINCFEMPCEHCWEKWLKQPAEV